MTEKYSYEFVKSYIENLGLKLLSAEYIDNRSKLEIMCKCGDIWETTFGSIRDKNRHHLCIKCSNQLGFEKKRFKYDDIYNVFKENGYELLEETYKNNNTKMSFKDKFGYKYSSRYGNFYFQFLQGKIELSPFNRYNKHTIDNIQLWISQNNKDYTFISGTYSNSNKKTILLSCNKCKEKFYYNWNEIYAGNQCPYCAGKRVSSKNNLLYLYPEISKEWDYSKNKNNPEDYTGCSSKKVYWICSVCNYSWKINISSRTSSGNGCPQCCLSKGERKITYFLNNKNIEYEVQKRFKDCRNIDELPFDFAIFYNNGDLMCLIEYDGEMHYEVCRYQKDNDLAIKKLNKTKVNDIIKTEYCKKNNIKLIRIPYWEFKNIEKILEKEFFK